MLDEYGVRDFTSETPGTRLVGDITYLRTGQGWLYLATVIDLCSGMVIGWAMADHLRANLCTQALTMARDHGYLTEPGSTAGTGPGTAAGPALTAALTVARGAAPGSCFTQIAVASTPLRSSNGGAPGTGRPSP